MLKHHSACRLGYRNRLVKLYLILPGHCSLSAPADVLAPHLRVALLELGHGGHAVVVVEQHDLHPATVRKPRSPAKVSASPTTTRGIWNSRIAPEHIWHGDSVVYSVVSA